ncbi:MAG: terminase small subunit [Lachnospiraceae bacterium]|jgi:phage terminase small subunit|nr:terminase small subunit [Lachnospiraceae bacterium]
MGEEKLTERQKRFIDYYIETGNSSEACRRAGYKGNNLNRIGSENLIKLDSIIKKRLEAKQSERIASQDEVLMYLTSVMRGQEKDTFDLDASLQDRTKAAELLGKRWGTFIDKKEVSGGAIVQLVDNIADDEDDN